MSQTLPNGKPICAVPSIRVESSSSSTMAPKRHLSSLTRSMRCVSSRVMEVSEELHLQTFKEEWGQTVCHLVSIL